MDKYQQLAELLSDEAKAKEILSESVEETQANLQKAGLEFTVEELQAIAQSIPGGEEEELNEDALEDVAGGAAPILVPAMLFAIGTVSVIARKWKKKR